MNNAFCYSRDKENELWNKLHSRLGGACLTVISRLVLDAAYQERVEDGIVVNRGQILISVDAIHLKTGLSVKTIRNALTTLEKLNETGKSRANQGANRKLLYTIVNYEVWDAFSKNGQMDFKQRGNQGANENEKGQMDFIGENGERGKSYKEVKEVKEKKIKEPFVATPESEHALSIWEEHRPLPHGADRLIYLKVMDELHRLDKVPWDGDKGIYEICRWAVTVWEKKHIQSPSKLRLASKTYPEMKQWQVIQGQIADKGPKAAPIQQRLYADPEKVRQTDHLGNPIPQKVNHA